MALTLAIIAAICFALAALVLAVMVLVRLFGHAAGKRRTVPAAQPDPRDEDKLKMTGWSEVHQWHRLHRYKNHLEHHRKVR